MVDRGFDEAEAAIAGGGKGKKPGHEKIAPAPLTCRREWGKRFSEVLG